MSVRRGTRLNGRYLLADRIAVGGMGEVWRGDDEQLGRTVAVKILRAELADDVAFRKRFRAEARTAARLPHPGIAQVFDYGETTVGPDGSSPAANPEQGDGIAYLVMELVPGEPLSAILQRDGALGTARTLAVVAQAAHALHAAHQRGVIHRDVKPANLMVTPEGVVKITDFGIARPTDHEPLTMTGQVMGTAHYLAPELARGQDASPLSDVYALGVVAYECLAGHRPFEGENQVLVATAHLNQQPPPLPGTLDPKVVRLVGAAMEKDPAHRIRSAEVFADALDKLAVHDPTALDDIGGPAGQVVPGLAAAPAVGTGGLSGAPADATVNLAGTPGYPDYGAGAGATTGPGTGPNTGSGSGPFQPPGTGSQSGGFQTGGAPWGHTAPQGYPLPGVERRFGAEAPLRDEELMPSRRQLRDPRGPSPVLLVILGLLAVAILVFILVRWPGIGVIDMKEEPKNSTTPTQSVSGVAPSLNQSASVSSSAATTATGRTTSRTTAPSSSSSTAPSPTRTSASPTTPRPTTPTTAPPTTPTTAPPTTPTTAPPTTPTTPTVTSTPTESVPIPSSPSVASASASGTVLPVLALTGLGVANSSRRVPLLTAGRGRRRRRACPGGPGPDVTMTFDPGPSCRQGRDV